jgi:hypothetical protein
LGLEPAKPGIWAGRFARFGEGDFDFLLGDSRRLLWDDARGGILVRTGQPSCQYCVDLGVRTVRERIGKWFSFSLSLSPLLLPPPGGAGSGVDEIPRSLEILHFAPFRRSFIPRCFFFR